MIECWIMSLLSLLLTSCCLLGYQTSLWGILLRLSLLRDLVKCKARCCAVCCKETLAARNSENHTVGDQWKVKRHPNDILAFTSLFYHAMTVTRVSYCNNLHYFLCTTCLSVGGMIVMVPEWMHVVLKGVHILCTFTQLSSLLDLRCIFAWM